MTYIDPRGKVFAHVDRLAAWRAGETPAPVTIEWDLSNRCPLGCQSCHFAYTHSRGPWTARPRVLPMADGAGLGDLADVALVSTALFDAQQMGVRSVVWSGGGEPTAHPAWPQVVELAHALGLRQGMYTMGGLLTTATAGHLARHADWVVVSLDAAEAAAYSAEKAVPPSRFDAACRGLAALAAAGSATVGASFLLHAGNWTRASEMLDLGRRLGATYVTFRPTIETRPDAPAVCTGDRAWVTEAEPLLDALDAEPDVEIAPERFAAYRDWSGHGYAACYGIRLATAVTPDGRVWVCSNRRGQPGSCLGDLRVEPFKAVWARHPRQWTDFARCRVMCRLHAVNETLEMVEAARPHEAFI